MSLSVLTQAEEELSAISRQLSARKTLSAREVAVSYQRFQRLDQPNCAGPFFWLTAEG
jgi:hypothetical protein